MSLPKPLDSFTSMSVEYLNHLAKDWVAGAERAVDKYQPVLKDAAGNVMFSGEELFSDYDEAVAEAEHYLRQKPIFIDLENDNED